MVLFLNLKYKVGGLIYSTNKVDLKDYLIFHLMMDILQIH